MFILSGAHAAPPAPAAPPRVGPMVCHVMKTPESDRHIDYQQHHIPAHAAHRPASPGRETTPQSLEKKLEHRRPGIGCLAEFSKCISGTRSTRKKIVIYRASLLTASCFLGFRVGTDKKTSFMRLFQCLLIHLSSFVKLWGNTDKAECLGEAQGKPLDWPFAESGMRIYSRYCPMPSVAILFCTRHQGAHRVPCTVRGRIT